MEQDNPQPQATQTTDENLQWEEYSRQLIRYLQNPENTSKINNMLLRGDTVRFTIDLDDLREQYGNELCQAVIKNPGKSLQLLHQQLQLIIEDINGSGQQQKKKQYGEDATIKKANYHIEFIGSLGRNLVTPRGIGAPLINQLIGVQGIVTRVSIFRPKRVTSVHYCETTQQGSVRNYPDEFNIEEPQTALSTAYPLKDPQGNPLSTEYGYCIQRDFQTLVLQEMPEKSPPGMLPRSVDVVLEDDLVEKVKPGDRVEVIGVFKCIGKQSGVINGVFKTVLVATSIRVIGNEVKEVEVSANDIENIKKISKRKDLLDLISESLAPAIQGHQWIKKAMLLMLLGGCEKTLENNTHIRGDINILVIGDPSTAKSQLLRRILSIAPLAINTTGRGSSGVGLTAALVMDKDTGSRHLEAGAMVLGDRGVVCIDEFDKMDEIDRAAIHEVMEQQTVTITKAGIHTSLNARCSVIAAANPVYGEYQRDLPPSKNIGLPDSLLSRFDLIFVVLDEKNSELDRLIAERVTRNHRYIHPSQLDKPFQGIYTYEDNYVIEPEETLEQSQGPQAPYQKFNKILHKSNQKNLLTVQFLKKYIHYAKQKFTPILNEESLQYISNIWKSFRQRDSDTANPLQNQSKIPITIRTLESLIRLSAAHAKLRLSRIIEVDDCILAAQLLRFALFNETDDELFMTAFPYLTESSDDDDKDNKGDKDKRQSRSKKIKKEEQAMEIEEPKKSSKKSKIKGTDEIQSKELGFQKVERFMKEMELQKQDRQREYSEKKEPQGRYGLRSRSQKTQLSELKKMKIEEPMQMPDPKLEVDQALNQAILKHVTITKKHQQFVFSTLMKLGAAQEPISIEKLWEEIQRMDKSQVAESLKSGIVQSKQELQASLQQLDEDQKILFSSDDNKIYLV